MLRNFLETLNEIHPTIKFTAEWSQKSINLLDVTVSLINGHIETGLCVKSTDSHQYLHSSSCHPFRKAFCRINHYALTEFALRTISLTLIVII